MTKGVTMRRCLIWFVVLALSASMSYAELGFQGFNVTTSSATKTIGGRTLLIINDGSGSIYVRVFWHGETSADATSSDTEVKTGEYLRLTKDVGLSQISLIAGSTQAVRLIYW